MATRYESLKQASLGMIHLALACIRLKRIENVNKA